MKTALIISAFAGILLASPALTQNGGHVHGSSHASGGGHAATVTLAEPGQGAFAALSEVVSVLEADPATDWTRVDLGGLREHLVDMDLVVTDAVATETAVKDGIRVTVIGDGKTRDAIHRMVPAHARELARDDRWEVAVTRTPTGAELTVIADDPATAARIRGLGFYGLMASQDHHREHHFGIATGAASH